MARAVPAIKPAAAAALSADGALIIDTRARDVSRPAHPYRAFNLGFGSKVGYWAGWVLPPDQPMTILLAEEPSLAQEAAMQLLRVGLDHIEGYIAGGFDAWKDAALPVATLATISAADLRISRRCQRGDDPHRRSHAEGDFEGHIDGAIEHPARRVAVERIADVPRGARVATMCEGGYRSSLRGERPGEHEGVEPLRQRRRRHVRVSRTGSDVEQFDAC